MSNSYASLPELSAGPPPTITTSPAPKHGAPTNTTNPTPIPSHYRQKIERRWLGTERQQFITSQEKNLIDNHITWAEDERMALAKTDTTDLCRISIEAAHKTTPKPTPSILQQSMNDGYTVRTEFGRIFKKLKAATNKLNNHYVQFPLANRYNSFTNQKCQCGSHMTMAPTYNFRMKPIRRTLSSPS